MTEVMRVTFQGCVGVWQGVTPCHAVRRSHICRMAKVRVSFREKRIAEGDWQIEAHCGESDVRIIPGLTSREDVRDWLDGPRKIAWLRSQGYAK